MRSTGTTPGATAFTRILSGAFQRPGHQLHKSGVYERTILEL
jgi:hypothetical protein